MRPVNQRGYNLVEIGIILAVVGLLLGASLIPLTQLTRQDKIRAEKTQLQAMQHAVIGYALTHKTYARQVELTGSLTGDSPYVFTLPAGRPYLPCPDVDGDGYEDRGQGGRLGLLSAQPRRLTISASSSAANPLLSLGNCLLSRGILPWKTLGVPPADEWGNRYTYQVDDAFSNALVGFNQDTVADNFDIRIPINPGAAGDVFSYARRPPIGTVVITATLSGTAYAFNSQRAPFVICDGDDSQSCAGNLLDLPLEAGIVATATVQASRRVYQPDDIVESPVYAIVSHGHNGNGAVNHIKQTVAQVMRCNPPIYQTTSPAVLSSVYLNEAHNFPFPRPAAISPAIANCPEVQFATPAYTVPDTRLVAGARVRIDGSDASEYDDLLVWSMPDEVFQPLIQAKTLPAADMPVLYLPR